MQLTVPYMVKQFPVIRFALQLNDRVVTILYRGDSDYHVHVLSLYITVLSTLTSKGLLYKVKEHVHDSRYRLGTKLLQLGHLVAERIELREIALPYMEQLAASINEVVHLVIQNNEEATYIEKVNSTRALSLQTKIGRSIPLYIGSGPKMC